MPWRVAGVMDLRIEFALCANRREAFFSRLCQEFGISRPTGYLWLNRYRDAGTVTGLKELSRRPHHSPNKTSDEVEFKVEELRQVYGWGARKLRILLLAEGHDIPEATINRILRRRGLVHADKSSSNATARFEKTECNQMLQMDFKGEYTVEGGKCYPLSLLDDCSRYLVGLWALPDQSTESVREALANVFREQGVPYSMLMDHGIPWWSTANGYGLTRLSVWLIKQGIRLIHSGIGHPQTQGKVERFHKTLKERTVHEGIPYTIPAWQDWAARFRDEYNNKRPHEALGLRPPAEIYKRENLRPYVEEPAEWDYGDARTAILNSSGCMYYKGRQYFICEALIGERVQVDEMDHLLLVTFRDTTIREINLRTGRTVAVVLPTNTNRGQKCKVCPDTLL